MAGVRHRSGGRNAKTAEQLAAHGTLRKDRHEGQVNPTPPVGLPQMPKPLEGDALAEWHRMIARLTASRTLSLVDDGALYQCCLLFAETEALAVTQAETGASVQRLEENLSGLEGAELVQCFQEITKLRQLESRYVSQIRQGRMAMRTYLVEFGLTPAARSRVRVVKGDDEQRSPLATLQAQASALRRVK